MTAARSIELPSGDEAQLVSQKMREEGGSHKGPMAAHVQSDVAKKHNFEKVAEAIQTKMDSNPASVTTADASHIQKLEARVTGGCVPKHGVSARAQHVAAVNGPKTAEGSDKAETTKGNGSYDDNRSVLERFKAKSRRERKERGHDDHEIATLSAETQAAFDGLMADQQHRYIAAGTIGITKAALLAMHSTCPSGDGWRKILEEVFEGLWEEPQNTGNNEQFKDLMAAYEKAADNVLRQTIPNKDRQEQLCKKFRELMQEQLEMNLDKIVESWDSLESCTDGSVKR
ncbi:hypothetical protein NA57DRAFT_75330 [Rhizodiscina lignyota]|uniref:SMP domain-containing protein n=1 Tax=Rhizodiscina lignyota TaxID=1504668 RepID=A0A9P4IKH6_9PEZI|nr:hypothetical protein NA57DRAFT_75330 [Rhizodiscina lignyota]